MQASISTNYNFGITAAQWIENVDVDERQRPTTCYGTLRQDVLDLTGRLTYAFTRNLTLQMYLQPFVAVGAYSDIRKLARPELVRVHAGTTIDHDPDFNTQVAAHQHRAALGVPARQHAVRRVESLRIRPGAPGRLLTVAGSRHRLRRRRHPRLHGEDELLAGTLAIS